MVHTELPRCSTGRCTETNNSVQPGQTCCELDVPKSYILFFLLKRISEGHHSTLTTFALADCQGNPPKAARNTHHGLLRNTPGSLGARLFIALNALRAYRNRHLGTLIHCCAAWELAGKCFDQRLFECIDFHGLSWIIASSHEKELLNEKRKYTVFPGRSCKKTMPERNAGSVFVPGVPRTGPSVSMPSPKKTVSLWKMWTNLTC